MRHKQHHTVANITSLTLNHKGIFNLLRARCLEMSPPVMARCKEPAQRLLYLFRHHRHILRLPVWIHGQRLLSIRHSLPRMSSLDLCTEFNNIQY